MDADDTGADQTQEQLDAQIRTWETRVRKLKTDKDDLIEIFNPLVFTSRWDETNKTLDELRERRRRNKPISAQVANARADKERLEKRHAASREKLEHLQHQHDEMVEAQRIALEDMRTQIETQRATIAKIANDASRARDEYTRLVNEEGGMARGNAPADGNQWDSKTCTDIGATARAFLPPEGAAALITMLEQLSKAAAAAGAAPTAPAAAAPAAAPVTVSAAGAAAAMPAAAAPALPAPTPYAMHTAVPAAAAAPLGASEAAGAASASGPAASAKAAGAPY